MNNNDFALFGKIYRGNWKLTDYGIYEGARLSFYTMISRYTYVLPATFCVFHPVF